MVDRKVHARHSGGPVVAVLGGFHLRKVVVGEVAVQKPKRPSPHRDLLPLLPRWQLVVGEIVPAAPVLRGGLAVEPQYRAVQKVVQPSLTVAKR